MAQTMGAADATRVPGQRWYRSAPLLAVPLLWPIARAFPSYDDPFITFRYAANLADGLGFVYNPGERVLSTTTPLYTLVLAFFRALGQDLPSTANWLGLLFLLGSAWLLFDLLPTELPPAWRGAGGLLLVLLEPPLRALASELPLYLLLVLATLWLAEREQWAWAGLSGGLALLTRGDGALVLVVIAGNLIRQRRWPSLLRMISVAMVVVLPWVLFSLAYFGSPAPVTLAAKQGQHAHIASTQSFLRGLVVPVNGLRKQLGNLLFAPFLGCAVSGLVAWLRRPWSLLGQWSVAYAIAYTVLRVASYPWYYVPLVPFAVWLLVSGLRELSRPVPAAGGTLGVILLLAVAAVTARIPATLPPPNLAAYREVGEWLAEHTPPTATVGMLEIGVIGYYSRRPVVDFAGLIQPSVAQLHGPSYFDWTRAAIWRYRPDYVALVDAFIDLRQEDWFARHYRAVTSFDHPGHRTVVFRRDGP